MYVVAIVLHVQIVRVYPMAEKYLMNAVYVAAVVWMKITMVYVMMSMTVLVQEQKV